MVETGHIGAVSVDDPGVAVGHPLRHNLGHARALLDPYRSGRPQTLDLGHFAEAGHGVRGERQQAVDGVFDLGITQHVHQLDGLLHLGVEVVGRKRHFGRRQRSFLVRRDLVGMMEDGPVGVGADLHGAGRLPLVAEGVHVPHDGVADLIVGLGQHVDGADVGHLVHGGDQRNVGVGHVGHLVGPHAAGDDHVVALDPALVGEHGLHLAPAVDIDVAVLGLDVEDLGIGEDLQRALVHGLLAHHSAGLERVDHRHRRAVEAALDHLYIDEGNQLLDLGRGEQRGIDPPGGGRCHAALQFVHALVGAGHLDAAGVDAEAEIPELVGALHTEQSHLLVVIDREDEVGGVTGGTAGVGQRALVDEDHVGPTEIGQVADHTIADDAGSDHDDLGAARKVAHSLIPFVVLVGGAGWMT